MSAEQINDIERVLKFEETKKIVEKRISRLTAPGENYGSLMLRVDLLVQEEEKCEEVKLVAKKLPPNKFLQEYFNTLVTFPKEVGFYKTVVPLLKELMFENGVKGSLNFVPEYFGSRLNLTDDNGKPDEDGVLFLENLKVKNFVVLDRLIGVDLKVAKLILNDLAHLHAVSIALKLQKKEIFQNQIRNFLTPWIAVPEHLNQLAENLRSVTKSIEKLKQYEVLMVEEFKKQMVAKTAQEPFATIVHDDCWINNAMIQFNGTEAIASKLVDFQLYSYGSPAKDIIFFLFTSLKQEVFENHFNELVLFYHEKFISILKDLHCDVSDFSFDAFQKEMDREGRNSQFGHIAFMLFVVFAVQKEVKSVDEINCENMVSENYSQLLKDKFVWFVDEFLKRGWIFNK